jgi:hypothetical protein
MGWAWNLFFLPLSLHWASRVQVSTPQSSITGNRNEAMMCSAGHRIITGRRD